MNSGLVSMQWQIVKRQSDEMYIVREALVRISVYVMCLSNTEYSRLYKGSCLLHGTGPDGYLAKDKIITERTQFTIFAPRPQRPFCVSCAELSCQVAGRWGFFSNANEIF